MKNIKSYNNFITESLTDKMKPKSKDEVENHINKLSFKEKLETAIKEDIVWIVKEIIPIKNIDVINQSLQRAALFNSIEVVKYLLDIGADIHYKEDAALRWACREGHYELVKLLLDKGADPTAKEHQAFDWAEMEKYEDILDLLKKYI